VTPAADQIARIDDQGEAATPHTAVRSRLGAKILAVMAGVLIVASLASLAMIIPLYHQELLSERQTVSHRLGAMLQVTLESAMIKRDLHALQEAVARLGESENVSAVMILSADGEVRFSSVPDDIGRRYRGLDEICPACGLRNALEETGAAFLRDSKGRELLRSVNVIGNRAACTSCHGSVAANPVIGALVVDYDATDLKRQAIRSAAFLGLAGFTVVLGALSATWIALRRLIFVPVHRITHASRALAAGDLTARAALVSNATTGTDEMAALGRQFDAMAARLEGTVTTLREHDRFLQALIDAVPDGIRVINEDFTVAMANKAFCAQVGLPLADVLGRPCYATSHQRGEPCVPTMVICPLKVLSEGSEAVIKCTHGHIDTRTGHEFAVEVIAARLEVENGRGRRRAIVESVRDLNQQVEVSQGQRLSEIGLLATGVAHEIHNPLASIRLGLNAIRRSMEGGRMDAEGVDYLEMLDTEIDRCLEVTKRLMWISQPPGGRGDLVDVDKVTHDVVALLRYEASVRNMDVVTDVPPRTRIVANSREIGMVLLNLIQNAFHASLPGGKIVVSARMSDADSVKIVVADSGVGIPVEDLGKIFYPFWSRRADGSSGSGLGLAICKAVIEKWGGHIEVRSKVGQGTEFELTFPHADKVVGVG